MTPPFTSSSCLADALLASCERHRDSVALIESDRGAETARLTYEDVRREALRFASLLIDSGLRPGTRCVFLFPNQSKWVVSAVAVVWAGGVIVPVDVKLPPAEQAALIAFSDPAVVVADETLWEKVEPLLEGKADVPVFHMESGATSRRRDWSETPASVRDLPIRRDRGDIAAIIFTSGTSGDPKGCMISDGAYLAQIEGIDRVFPLAPGDRYLSLIPANHVIDFMCGFLLPLVSGAAVVHLRTLRSQHVTEALRHYKITCTALVPMILRSMRSAIEQELERAPKYKRALVAALMSLNGAFTRKKPRFALSRRLFKPLHDALGGYLARVVVGGAPVEPRLADFFQKFGIGIHIGYGLTEVCTVIALNDLRPYRNDTVGRILHGGEIRIDTPNAEGLGEILVRAPFLMSGYFRNESLTAETIINGWLKTGDLGRIDQAGHLKLMGRTKNMIVTEGGKNVYPEDVETAFDGIDGFEEHCALASHLVFPGKVSAAALKDRLILIVRPRANAYDAFGIAIQSANRRLDHYRRIAGYLVWPDPFPRTASLKIKRETLARAIRESQAVPQFIPVSPGGR